MPYRKPSIRVTKHGIQIAKGGVVDDTPKSSRYWLSKLVEVKGKARLGHRIAILRHAVLAAEREGNQALADKINAARQKLVDRIVAAQQAMAKARRKAPTEDELAAAGQLGFGFVTPAAPPPKVEDVIPEVKAGPPIDIEAAARAAARAKKPKPEPEAPPPKRYISHVSGKYQVIGPGGGPESAPSADLDDTIEHFKRDYKHKAQESDDMPLWDGDAGKFTSVGAWRDHLRLMPSKVDPTVRRWQNPNPTPNPLGPAPNGPTPSAADDTPPPPPTLPPAATLYADLLDDYVGDDPKDRADIAWWLNQHAKSKEEAQALLEARDNAGPGEGLDDVARRVVGKRPVGLAAASRATKPATFPSPPSFDGYSIWSASKSKSLMFGRSGPEAAEAEDELRAWDVAAKPRVKEVLGSPTSIDALARKLDDLVREGASPAIVDPEYDPETMEPKWWRARNIGGEIKWTRKEGLITESAAQLTTRDLLHHLAPKMREVGTSAWRIGVHFFAGRIDEKRGSGSYKKERIGAVVSVPFTPELKTGAETQAGSKMAPIQQQIEDLLEGAGWTRSDGSAATRWTAPDDVRQVKFPYSDRKLIRVAVKGGEGDGIGWYSLAELNKMEAKKRAAELASLMPWLDRLATKEPWKQHIEHKAKKQAEAAASQGVPRVTPAGHWKVDAAGGGVGAIDVATRGNYVNVSFDGGYPLGWDLSGKRWTRNKKPTDAQLAALVRLGAPLPKEALGAAASASAMAKARRLVLYVGAVRAAGVLPLAKADDGPEPEPIVWKVGSMVCTFRKSRAYDGGILTLSSPGWLMPAHVVCKTLEDARHEALQARKSELDGLPHPTAVYRREGLDAPRRRRAT